MASFICGKENVPSKYDKNYRFYRKFQKWELYEEFFTLDKTLPQEISSEAKRLL